jgi:hypothetical protein
LRYALFAEGWVVDTTPDDFSRGSAYLATPDKGIAYAKVEAPPTASRGKQTGPHTSVGWEDEPYPYQNHDQVSVVECPPDIGSTGDIFVIDIGVRYNYRGRVDERIDYSKISDSDSAYALWVSPTDAGRLGTQAQRLMNQ